MQEVPGPKRGRPLYDVRERGLGLPSAQNLGHLERTSEINVQRASDDLLQRHYNGRPLGHLRRTCGRQRHAAPHTTSKKARFAVSELEFRTVRLSVVKGGSMKFRYRPSLVAIVSSLALMLFLVGCGSSNQASSGGSEPGQKVITVGIDIPFHPLFDYVAAKKDDYFGGKPYTVNFRVLDASTQVPAFGRGTLDVMTTPPSFIPRVTDQYGMEAAMFFPMARWTIGPQILVPSDSPYKTLEDLKGKTVAVPPLQTRFGAEEAAISAATGEDIRDYFDLQQTDAAAQELKLGRVDAAFIEAPTTFPLLEDGKFKAIYSVHDAFLKAFDNPAVVNGGYIAQTSFIENNQQFVNDLTNATQDAWSKYQQNPDAVNRVASEQSGIAPEQLAVVGDVLDLTKMPEKERCITAEDVRTWNQIFPLLEKSGFIEQAPKNAQSLFVVGNCAK